MKNTLILILVLLSTLQSLAQKTYMVSVHTGLSNTLRGNIRNEYSLDGLNVNYNGIGPVGVRGTAKINDRFSLGIDLIYGSASAKFSQTDTTFSNGQWNYTTNEYDVTKRRLRTQFRFNRHFGNDVNFDQYVGFGIGGNIRWTKEYVNDSLTTPETNEFAIPLSMRICYGFQYYPTYHFGIGGEIAIGGPFIQLVGTYRF